MIQNIYVLSADCSNCNTQLIFSENSVSVECTGCGLRLSKSMLKNLQRVKFLDVMEGLLNEINKSSVKCCNKVNGFSNHLCAMLSHLLTNYGMDRAGKAQLLTEMGKAPKFDCALLADRAFLIEPENLAIPGYGKDISGSIEYLQDTLQVIKYHNENEERLIPIHADGDGHCLVHAVSRSLVGWQLFWHPLRIRLMDHFTDNLIKYQMQFKDFIDDKEWELIITECDPDYTPSNAEPSGLRNIHIFGLANILKRPIILLDSLAGIQSPGDYSAIFLPSFSSPSECMNKHGVLHPPICIAWSSSGRNHFIPLVGVKGRKCPVLPRVMIQRSWGVADTEIDSYVKFDDKDCCLIGGENVLQAAYCQRLVEAMSKKFFEKFRISPFLLSDVYLDIYKPKGVVLGMNLDYLSLSTLASIEQNLLLYCTKCHTLCLVESERCCQSGGELYNMALKLHRSLVDKQQYFIPGYNLLVKFDAIRNRLVIVEGNYTPYYCPNCQNIKSLRLVEADYKIHYVNGDSTTTVSKTNKISGYKYYYNGQEVDYLPKLLKVHLDWAGQSYSKELEWFENQEDPNDNSNAYILAQKTVQEMFPGEFGSERLVQKVVDQILQLTMPTVPVTSDQAAGPAVGHPANWLPDMESKAILTGFQSVHKEELNKSEMERRLQQQIKANSTKQQRKLSDQLAQSPEPGYQKTKDIKLLQSPVSPATSSRASPDPTELASHSLMANKGIRLSTSDGRNVTLPLPQDYTFTQLQSMISEYVNVSPSNMRIKHGFPPRELKPPASPKADYQVPIQPGDKIIVDILDPVAAQSKSSPASADVKKFINPHLPTKPLSWTSFAEGGMDEASDRVLQELMMPRHDGRRDSLDQGLSAIALTAALENKDLWTYVQQKPHLFSVNGLFYDQVKRDMGLEHGKHCQLPHLPHKIFAYNKFDDRLELCLEPYGHFPVEANVEKMACTMSPASRCGTSSRPFSGQGHLLNSTSQEERMPTDIPMSPKRNEARRLNNMCDPAMRQDSIEEEDEEASAAEDTSTHRLNPLDIIRNLPLVKGGQPDAKLVRKGPGYSELSPIPENATNERLDLFQQIMSKMEKVVECIDNEDAVFEIPPHSTPAVDSSSNINRTAMTCFPQSFTSLSSPTYINTNKNRSMTQPMTSCRDLGMSSVAALAEEVAFNIAAMDTEVKDSGLVSGGGDKIPDEQMEVSHSKSDAQIATSTEAVHGTILSESCDMDSP